MKIALSMIMILSLGFVLHDFWPNLFLSKYDICTAVDNLIQFALEWISIFSFQMMETVNFSLKSEK